MEPGSRSSGIGPSLAKEIAKERRPMTLSWCIWWEEKSPPGTNTLGHGKTTLRLANLHRDEHPSTVLAGRGLNWEQTAKVFSRCSMKMRTLVDSLRLAGHTARIGTVRSNAVRRRTTVPSLTSAAKSHAGAWAIPARASRRNPERSEGSAWAGLWASEPTEPALIRLAGRRAHEGIFIATRGSWAHDQRTKLFVCATLPVSTSVCPNLRRIAL